MREQLISAPSAPATRTTLGDRVRQLRIANGLTQTELAGERFSKEYVSQIERGKTRPTGETIEWLAARLGVDQSFLETGVSSSERERVESVIARAEAQLESHEYAEVVPILQGLKGEATGLAGDLQFRALRAEAWARLYLGQARDAIALLERGPGSPVTASARSSSSGGRAAIAGSATGRLRAKTSSVRSSSARC
jgi:transcriptional regulator with XRE-family HTH domain